MMLLTGGEGALQAAARTGCHVVICICRERLRRCRMTRNMTLPRSKFTVFESRIAAAMAAGSRSKISVDPIFGFGKTFHHNLQL